MGEHKGEEILKADADAETDNIKSFVSTDGFDADDEQTNEYVFDGFVVPDEDTNHLHLPVLHRVCSIHTQGSTWIQ